MRHQSFRGGLAKTAAADQSRLTTEDTENAEEGGLGHRSNRLTRIWNEERQKQWIALTSYTESCILTLVSR